MTESIEQAMNRMRQLFRDELKATREKLAATEARVAALEAGLRPSVEETASRIVRDVAELSDRTSPEDDPEQMGVTSEELHAIVTAALLATAPERPEPAFQDRAQSWLIACFGRDIANDRTERNHRFLEEALELVQANGCTQSEARQLVDYVYGRPAGNPDQEVGGVMNTLAALCCASGLRMFEAGAREMDRVEHPSIMAKIREKQAAKPKHSPLPEAPERPEVSGAMRTDLREAGYDPEKYTLLETTEYDRLTKPTERPEPTGAEMGAVLHLFREFVISNATQWKTGAGANGHPMWALVAEALGDTKDVRSGPEWQFIQPGNRTKLEELRALPTAPASPDAQGGE